MKEVHDGVAFSSIGSIIRREIDKHVAIRRVLLQIAFQRLSVNLEVLDGSCFTGDGACVRANIVPTIVNTVTSPTTARIANDETSPRLDFIILVDRNN
jgi:hypothetical protein